MPQQARKLMKRREGFPSSRFITFSCDNQDDLLASPECRDRFVARLKLVRHVLPIRLYEWVVMMNHIHLLLYLVDEGLKMETVLHRLKTKFAIDELRKLRAAGVDRDRFWLPGGGYDRNIFSEDEFEEKRDYIINNPVKAGYVLRVEDWKWSSVGWEDKFWDDPHDW